MIRVEEMMSTDPVCVSADVSLKEALSLCETKRIRHLPVLENDQLIGIVSDRDLRDGSPPVYEGSSFNDNVGELVIRPLMKTEVITIHPLAFVEEAAYTMYTLRIGCLPVVRSDQLIGIVTKSDLMRTLIEVMGVHEPSSYIKIDITDLSGQVGHIVNLLLEHNVEITNMYMSHDKNEQKKHLNLQLQTIDPRHSIRQLQQNGFRVLWPQYYEEWL